MRAKMLLLLSAWPYAAMAQPPIAVRLDTTPAHVLNKFVPQQAFGVGLDGQLWHMIPSIYTKYNVGQMLGAGLGNVSYRLYTELSVQDWHWNPTGTFSETASQGYWTSSASPGAHTLDTFGYRLPRRGFTMDQGNNDDYSRLDDGNPATFWKSNPYLSPAYTGDPETMHQQWVLYDLGSAMAVNAAQITWANPYATAYAIQYWTGDDPIYDAGNGSWATFPNGAITTGAGGTVTLSLGSLSVPVEYIRILLQTSSGTCTRPNSPDTRDCTGYAIAEAGFGRLANGVFTDFVSHSRDQNQTVTYASSVDPWHAAGNRVTDQEQPGLDIVFTSGVTRGLPTMVPIPMLYSTPANAAAEITYLEASKYKIARVEMGEEPDGQYVTPEDYAALYVQFAAALHAVDPTLQLGGPVFEDNSSDLAAWPDPSGQTSWLKRFVAYLTSHNALQNFNFFSFEHYPFADCGSTAQTQHDLVTEPDVLQNIIGIWRSDNLPANIPIYVTETNYSQNETNTAQQPAGSVWYAEMMGTLLGAGMGGSFLYEYEPLPLSPPGNCPSYGTYGILQGNNQEKATYALAQFFAARVMTGHWALNMNQAHALFPAAVPNGWIRAYPLARPDGSWAVLLVNRSLTDAYPVTLTFAAGSATKYFSGTLTRTDFGPAQYRWIADGANSQPKPDGPKSVTNVQGGAGSVYSLPAASITVLSGTIQ